jgi:outer membrane protein TolC
MSYQNSTQQADAQAITRQQALKAFQELVTLTANTIDEAARDAFGTPSTPDAPDAPCTPEAPQEPISLALLHNLAIRTAKEYEKAAEDARMLARTIREHLDAVAAGKNNARVWLPTRTDPYLN